MTAARDVVVVLTGEADVVTARVVVVVTRAVVVVTAADRVVVGLTPPAFALLAWFLTSVVQRGLL